jgi:hypothetical protein
MARPAVEILRIESMPHLRQTGTNPKVGLDFDSGVRKFKALERLAHSEGRAALEELKW